MNPLDVPQGPAATPLSHELCDAAAELACRIELGEYDDLDETQMSDLCALANMMASWAAHAQALELGEASNSPLIAPLAGRGGSVYRN